MTIATINAIKILIRIVLVFLHEINLISTLDQDRYKTLINNTLEKIDINLRMKNKLLLRSSASILVDIKADLRSNSELLEVNLTRRSAKIDVLDVCAYPESRLTYSRLCHIASYSHCHFNRYTYRDDK